MGLDAEKPDQEPESTESSVPLRAIKGRQSLLKVRRELSEDELKSPAVQRMLVDEIERLERETVELSAYRVRFHEADKQVATLTERSKHVLSVEIVFAVCMTVGAAMLGYAPSLWNQQPAGWLTVIFGCVLILGGISSRVVRR